MSAGPSPHLAWSELACNDIVHTPYPLDWRTDPTRGVALGRAFEDVRLEVSIAMGHETVLICGEGYRTQAHQAYLRTIPKYKAALHSQHCEGRAIDAYCPRGMDFDEFEACVRRACARLDNPIRYVELRPTMRYIHFDVRPTKKLIVETIT